MPELPEAEVVLRQLQMHILGATIRKCCVGRKDIIREGLGELPWFPEARIQDIQRQGKSIQFTCVKQGQQRFILTELGMTGLLLFQRADRRLERHTHMILSLEGGKEPEVRYWNARRFGRVYLLDREGLEYFLSRRFGPDPLAIELKDFQSLIQRCRGRIKAMLLNQRKLAGIGNIYANEILYRAGIHPHVRGMNLSRPKIQRLYGSMQGVLQEAITCGGSTIRDFRAPDGSPGHYQERHQVYQKGGLPCPRGCGVVLKSLVAERTSFFCPVCQRRTS